MIRRPESRVVKAIEDGDVGDVGDIGVPECLLDYLTSLKSGYLRRGAKA